MQVIAHAITFDFWNTLATPSKQYAEERTKYLSQYGITKDDYKKAKKNLDEKSDSSRLILPNNSFNTLLGKVVINDSDPMNPYKAMNYLFRIAGISASDANIEDQASEKIGDLFLDHPPEIKDPFLDEVFELLDQNKIMRGIISNTNFISGVELTKVIPDEYKFDSLVYSDMVGVSKPNPLIYYATAKSFGVNNPGDIMIHHIGDNLVTDVEGPRNAGYKGYHIKTKQDILETVKRIIEENNLYETERNILVA